MNTRRTRKKGWGGSRPGAGRPKLPRKERQDVAFLIRMKPAEIAALRRLARDTGTTLGVYSRQVLRRHIKRAGR